MSRARDVASRDIVDSAVTSVKIANGAITNDDVNASAAIAASKLSGVVTPTSTDTLTNKIVSAPVFIAPEERANVVAAAATGTINLDALTSTIWYYTSNASANFTLNVRGNSGTTLDSLLAVGDSITVAFLNTNGATPFFNNVFQVDGVTRTVRWSGGTAPSAGNASSIDVYTYTIMKTAATPTYLVLGGQGRFA